MASSSLNDSEECIVNLPTSWNSLQALIMAISGYIHSKFLRNDPIDSLHGHIDKKAIGKCWTCFQWPFESQLW